MAAWPGGARGALCLSFDNLGEAAELELGVHAEDAPLGEHFTATRVLPSLLGVLGERELPATFFVEGLNAELYPDALESIASAGHEVAYHAWRHERWDGLSAEAQAENLASGIAAFETLGLSLAGMRPPGGQLGAGGIGVMREAGLSYCSPAGEGASADGNVALLPFRWRHVDASCVLPPLAPVREQITRSAEPLSPGAFLVHMEGEIGRLAREGGFATIVLHLAMLDWLGEERLDALLDLVRGPVADGTLWIARCMDVAERVVAAPDTFEGGTELDAISWAD